MRTWGAALQYDSLPEFTTLKEEHRNFHKVVADIIRRADAHEDVSKEVSIGQKSDFNTASVKVINAISAIRDKSK